MSYNRRANLKNLSKKAKTLIFSVAGLAVLTALTLIIVFMQNDEIPDNDEILIESENRIIFTDLTPEDVISIEIKNEHGEYTVIHTGDNNFAIPQLLGAPTIDSRLLTAARNMSGFWALELVEENCVNLEQYGLQNPSAWGKVAFTNGEALEIHVGENTPTAELLTYVRLADSNDVYAVRTFLVDFLRENLFYYVSLIVTPEFTEAGFPTIDRLVIERAGHERYIAELIPRIETETAVNSHRLVQPLEIEIDHERGGRLLQGLFGLRATGVAYVGTELLTEFFEEPTAVVFMTIGENVSFLAVGADENDENYYAVHSDHPDVVYIFPPESLSWFLNLDAEKIMATRIHMPLIYIVSELTIETPRHTLGFRLTGESVGNEAYFLNGEQVNTELFKSLYRYTISINAAELYKDEPQNIADMPFLARFVFSYKNDRPDDVFEFYDAGSMRAVISVNGVPRFTKSIGYLNRLEENLELYLAGEPLILTWL